jgi:hypothetical protein
VVLFWLFCGALLLLLTRTVEHDEASVQRAVRAAFASAKETAHLKSPMADTADENQLGVSLLGSPSRQRLHPDGQKHPHAAGYASIET